MARTRILRIASVSLLLACTLLSLGCSSSRRGLSALGDESRSRAKSPTLQETLSQLQALKPPSGVDESLFFKLKDALANELISVYGEDFPKGQRFTLRAPTGTVNKPNLSFARQDGGVAFSWKYKNLGDYNQDGTVDIADITALADNFFDPASTENEWIDGNFDGTIDIADVTPLAENFFIQVAYYALEGSDDGNTYSRIDVIPQNEGGGNERKEYSISLASPAYRYYRVVPFDSEDTAGEPSNSVDVSLPQVQPPNIIDVNPKSGVSGMEVQFNATVTGDAPISFTWDFGGGASPNNVVTDVPAATVTLGAPNDYTVSVHAENAAGSDDFSFTLSVSAAAEPPIVNSVSPLTGTEFTQVQFTADVTGTPPFTFQWTFDPSFNPPASTDESPIVILPSASRYACSVRVENAIGFSVFPFTVEVTPAQTQRPKIESISPLRGVASQNTAFTAVVSGTPPFTYNWNFGGGADPNTSSLESPWVTLGAAGEYSAFLEVTNSAGSDRKDFTLVIVPPGEEWTLYLVDDSRHALYSSLANIGGKPAIAYFDDNAEDLMYAYNPAGSGSGTWSIVTADSKDMGLGDVGTYASLAEINGGVGISYYEGGTDMNLKFAFNANPDGSGTWLHRVVDTEGDTGWITSLAEVQGRPAIGFFSENVSVNYKFAICDAGDGQGDWTVASVADVQSGLFAEGRVLSILAGRPAVAFYNWNTGELQFSINTSPDGTGTWTSSTVNSGRIILFVSMGVVNGLPAIAYRDFDAGGLHFAINTESDGSGAWSNYEVVPGISAWHTSVIDVGGFPAVAFTDFDAGQVGFAINDQPNGSGNWTITVVDSGDQPAYTSAALIGGHPAIAYCKTATGALFFAIRNY